MTSSIRDAVLMLTCSATAGVAPSGITGVPPVRSRASEAADFSSGAAGPRVHGRDGRDTGQHRGIPPLAAALLCFVLSMAMHLPWLANTPIAGTEGHRIFPAHSMVQTHWWLVPMLFDKPFMTKPPLHHWLIALSEMASGGGESFNVAGPKAMFFWRLPSAIAGALLCAAVCWFAGRWFGRTAGLISGLCAVGMIAIWGQSQVADIDSTNTLATVLAALCGVELLIAGTNNRGFWLVAASLAMGAMWLTKGPAGLPIVLGVWLWAAVLGFKGFRQERKGQDTGGPPVPRRAHRVIAVACWLLPLLVGVAIFFGWAIAAKHSLHTHGMELDRRGVKEGTDRLLAKNPLALLVSLFWMLPQVVGFAVPMTLAVPLYFRADIRSIMSPANRRIATALTAATLISWGVCVIAGMSNPRYAYPTLMLLCPLSGAVAVAAVKIPRAAEWLRGIGIFTAVAFVIAALALAFLARKDVQFGKVLVASSIIAALVAVISVRLLSRTWSGAWGLVILALATSIPFGIQRHYARTIDSGINVAAKLREIVGNQKLAVCGAATSKPEAFFYAGIHPDFVPLYDFNPKGVEPGTWVMLDQAEHKHWLKQPNSQLEQDRKICKWGKTEYYLAWYSKPVVTSPPTKN
ncbi:MAG TPA: glycosyltransferase family 39 protein [Tepidisphaeraceae bacterium]|jgi:4-amino-4-deoxy-L-arabinose transferase-like glycosyltransferase|nr:glycosyltransferase family 39 protein [Tepidisphaeraceae bacterium]